MRKPKNTTKDNKKDKGAKTSQKKARQKSNIRVKKEILVPVPKKGEKEYKKLFVYFLDVGKADCILIYSRGKSMLVDGGNDDDGTRVVSFLKRLGIQTLNYMIVTHPDEDHIGGLDEVLKEFKVKRVYVSGQKSSSKNYDKLIDAIVKEGIFKVRRTDAGEKLRFARCKVKFLSSDKNVENPNDASIVFRLKFKNSSFLFTGDASTVIEEKLCALEFKLKSDVLKVSHHGADNASCPNFVSKVLPMISVICVGENKYGHPSEKVISRLKKAKSKVYRTDENGTILIKTSGRRRLRKRYDVSFIDV